MLCLETRRASQCETGRERPWVTTSKSLKDLPENGQSSVLPCPVMGRASINRETDERSVQNHLPQGAAIRKGEACDVASSQPPSLQPWKRHTSVPLGDARLLVEAMSSPGEKDSSSHQGMAVEPVRGPSAGALQTTGGALADLQTPPHSFKSPTFTQPSETESHLRVSRAATSSALQPLQQHGSTLKTTVLPENKKAPNQETVMRSLEPPVAPDKEPTVSQNEDNTPEVSAMDNPSSKVHNKCSQSCSRFNREAGLKVPPSFNLKPSAVVRLTRLPFLMSNKESVLISRLSMSAGWGNYSALNQDAGHDESSASEALPCHGSRRASTPSRESPPVHEESEQAVTITSSPVLTGSPNMSQSLMTTVQPGEKKTASKDQEKVVQLGFKYH